MKSRVLRLTAAILLLGQLTHAQSSPADAINTIKNQKRILDIAQRVEERKLKLVQLEKELAGKSNDKEKAVRESEESANDNRQAAVKLSDDAQDRKKAKKAEKRSDEAKRDAKRARRVTSSVKELEGDISQLKKKIAEDEQTLSKLNVQTAKQ